MITIHDQIKRVVTTHPIVLFMKGTKQFPQYGFSSRVVQILKAIGCESYITVNVLEDDAVYQDIKEYSGWSTIPQLYVNGEFVGDADIMMEMHEAGELQELFKAWFRLNRPKTVRNLFQTAFDVSSASLRLTQKNV